MKYRNKVLAVLLVALVTAVPLAACSQKTASASAEDVSSRGQGNASSQTRIVGKVTSVIGNQVVLAVGTMKNTGGFGGRAGSSGQSGTSSQDETASSSVKVSGGSSSADLTLTGETQTLLIPVGLTLSYGGTTARRSGGSAGGQTGSQSGGGSAGGSAGGSGGRSFGGGSAGGTSGGSFGGFGGTSGSGTSRSGGAGASGSRSGGSAGGTSAGTAGSTLATLQRSQDFSSIKKGMVLQIAEETLSDGTQGITQVRVISQ